MPFQTGATPFTGDQDIADFMLDVFKDFAVNTMGWVDSAPALGTHPDYEFWFHRGTGGAPEAPFAFYRTSGDGDMYVFTGDGIDTLQEIYDQPNNPMNAPASIDFSTPAISRVRCPFLNDVVGPFQAYWLFGPTDGSYIHCVIKVAARQYRHFHVGLVTPFHSDLDDSAFYVTGHTWDQLDPSGRATDDALADGEHDPYGQHRHPFGHANINGEHPAFNRPQLRGQWLYMPGLNAGVDWYMMTESESLTVQDQISVSKEVGDVNNADNAVTFGIGNITGWTNSLGTVLYCCERTFSSNAVPLIPIYVGAAVPFASATRVGVVGQVPDVFRVNMRFLEPEQEIIVGSDTYVVFPLINKDNQNVLAGEGYSAYEGLAYRKITDPVV